MAKAVNQNDLVDIIKAQVESLTDIMEVVFSATNKKVISASNRNNVDKFKECLQIVFGKDGVLDDILRIDLQKFNKMPSIKSGIIIEVINGLRAILTCLSWNALILMFTTGLLAFPIFSLYLKLFNKFLPFLFDTLNLINKLSIKQLLLTPIKIFILEKNLKPLINLIKSINIAFGSLPINPFILISMAYANLLMMGYYGILYVIDKAPKFWMKRQINKMRQMVRPIRNLLRSLSLLTKGVNLYRIVKDIAAVNLVFTAIGYMLCTLLLLLPVMLIFILASPIIVLSFLLICLVIWALVKLLNWITGRILKTAIKGGLVLKILAIMGIIFMVILIGLMLVVLGLLAEQVLLGTAAIIGLFLALIIIAFLIALFGEVFKSAGKSILLAFVGVLFVAIFLGFLLVIAIMLLVLSFLIMPVVSSMPMFLLFFVGFIAIAALIAGFGLLVSYVMAPLALALAGIAIVTFAIGMILAMAAMLWLLGKIKLDKEAILNSVNVVFETAFAVIGALFNNDKSKDVEAGNDKDKEQSWFKGVLEQLGGGVVKIIQAILSVYFLAATLVSIFLILFIAGMLWLLGKIELNPEAIEKNVKQVIKTAHMVSSAIYQPVDDKSQPTKKGFIQKTIEYFNPGMVKILDAIMSIQFLALTLLSIFLLNLVAHELQWLQSIELSSEKIEENIEIVIKSAQAVSNSIYDNKDDKNNPSEKGFIQQVIEFFNPGMVKILDAIMSVAFLAVTLLSVMLIKLMADELSTIGKINLNVNDVVSKVESIVSGAQKIINAIIKSDDTSPKEGKSVFRKLLEAALPDKMLPCLDAIMAIGKVALMFAVVGIVANLAESLSTIHKLPSMDNIETKVNSITSTADKIINKIIEHNKNLNFDKTDKYLTLLEKMCNIYNRFVDETDVNNAEKLTNNYIKFIDKINGVDIENLKTTERLFGNMAAFSHSISGNFDALADALNEKIAPLLEKLEETVKQAAASADAAAQRQLQATVETSQSGASDETITAAAGGNNDKKEQLQKQTTQKNRDERKKINTLDQLADILLGTGGHKGVKIDNRK